MSNNDNNNETSDTSDLREVGQPEGPEMVKLGSKFDQCLIGASISFDGARRFTYSVSAMLLLMLEELQEPLEKLRHDLANDMFSLQSKFGDKAPLFIDDELVMGEVTDPKDSPINQPNSNIRILTPGDYGFEIPN